MKIIIIGLIAWLIFPIAACVIQNSDAEEMPAELNIPKYFTLMNSSGVKNGERISSLDFNPYFVMNDVSVDSPEWNIKNGDMFFFRGEVVSNYSDDKIAFIVPLEDQFYWNGVCFYHDGYCYQIMKSDEGLRIYNAGLWRLKKYCVVAQMSPTQTLTFNPSDVDFLKNIHKVKGFRGKINKNKVAEQNPQIMNAPGLIWKFYQSKGKQIRGNEAKLDIQAEDFIVKTDVTEDGYYQSATADFEVKKVHVSISNGIDCSKVW